MIRENPYVLCSSGLYIGFERGRPHRMGMDRPSDDPRRVEAGLLYVLRHNLGNGHTCLPADKLVPAAADMLGIDTALAGEVLEQMLTGAGLAAERGSMERPAFCLSGAAVPGGAVYRGAAAADDRLSSASGAAAGGADRRR